MAVYDKFIQEADKKVFKCFLRYKSNFICIFLDYAMISQKLVVLKQSSIPTCFSELLIVSIIL